MVTTSAIPKPFLIDEPDWHVVFYELDLEAIGPSWDAQVTAAYAFQDAQQHLSVPSE